MVNWWFGLVVWDTNSPLVDLGGFSVLSFLKKSPKHVFFPDFGRVPDSIWRCLKKMIAPWNLSWIPKNSHTLEKKYLFQTTIFGVYLKILGCKYMLSVYIYTFQKSVWKRHWQTFETMRRVKSVDCANASNTPVTEKPWGYDRRSAEEALRQSKGDLQSAAEILQVQITTWRIIPFSKWLITMASRSPK